MYTTLFHTTSERLELLGLERLESRRIRADILFTYKLLLGLTALHSDDFFILSESTCTRGHPYKLFYRVVQLMSASIIFCHRTVKVWNELPTDTDFSSIDLFKRALDGIKTQWRTTDTVNYGYQRLQRPQSTSKEHTLAGEWFNTARCLLWHLILILCFCSIGILMALR